MLPLTTEDVPRYYAEMKALERFISLILLIGLVETFAFAQRQSTKELYEGKEYMIPMRDGTKLRTLIWTPKDFNGSAPMLMERTPYGAGSLANGPRRAGDLFVNAKYILAFQDVRGKGGSEGDYVNIRPPKKGSVRFDESTDTWDTCEFLTQNVSKFNGNIGLWGISYPGFYAGASVINTHPAIKATSPQAPVADWFVGDDVHHNGALFLQETFDFCVGFDVPRGGQRPTFDRGTGSAYEFYLGVGALPNFDKNLLKGLIPYWNDDLMAHDTFDEYWVERSLPRNFKNVKCAVLTVGGFFDKEDMWGALNLYQYGEKQNKSPNFLVMGPWPHGGWGGGPGSSLGDIAFGTKTGDWYRENLEFRFFEKYLNNKDVPDVAEATVFSTGENKWYAFDKWPPELKEKSIYFGPNKSLAWKETSIESQDSYVNDPAKPTPYLWDFVNSKRAPGDWLIYNQADFAIRPDVLHYVSEPLAEDFQACGKITADMWIKTTGTDCDLVVKVIDVYPGDATEVSARNTELKMASYQMMVRSDIFRAKFRKDFSKPIPIVPGQLTQVKFDLNETMHTFKKGHRIAIQVQSSWFPIADRNPNKFMNIHLAKDADFQPATISLVYGTPKLSKVIFRQLAKPTTPISMLD